MAEWLRRGIQQRTEFHPLRLRKLQNTTCAYGLERIVSIRASIACRVVYADIEAQLGTVQHRDLGLLDLHPLGQGYHVCTALLDSNTERCNPSWSPGAVRCQSEVPVDSRHE